MGAGCEVALLVEDGVVGEEPLVIAADHLPASTEAGGVAQVAIGVDEPDDRRATARAGCHLVEGAAVVGDEPGLQHEVLGRVAREGQLGEDRKIGTSRLRALVRLEDASRRCRRDHRRRC